MARPRWESPAERVRQWSAGIILGSQSTGKILSESSGSSGRTNVAPISRSRSLAREILPANSPSPIAPRAASMGR